MKKSPKKESKRPRDGRWGEQVRTLKNQLRKNQPKNQGPKKENKIEKNQRNNPPKLSKTSMTRLIRLTITMDKKRKIALHTIVHCGGISEMLRTKEKQVTSKGSRMTSAFSAVTVEVRRPRIYGFGSVISNPYVC